MPRKCSICTSPKRAEADAALLGGTHQKIVAQMGGWTQQSVSRHVASHLRKQLHHAAAIAGMLVPQMPPATASPGAALAAALPSLNSLSAVASRLSGIADHMKKEREDAAVEGARGQAIAAGMAERGALSDLSRMIQGVQDAVNAQAQRSDERWGELVGVVLAEISDDDMRAAIARKLANVVG